MCGRSALIATPEEIAELFGLAELPELGSRFNIAPSQRIAVVRAGDGPGAARRLDFLRWGLVPSTARDLPSARGFINARAESVTSKPAFRDSIRRRRCLMVASGFYEWKRDGKRKQPFFIHRPDGQVMAFAAIWDRARDPDGHDVETCAVLTRGSLPPIDAIHDRMPLTVAPEQFTHWLDPHVSAENALARAMEAAGRAQWEAYPVGTMVNNPAHDVADCLLRATALTPGTGAQGTLELFPRSGPSGG